MTGVRNRTVIRNEFIELELTVIGDFTHNQTGDTVLNNDGTRVRQFTTHLSVTEFKFRILERVGNKFTNSTKLVQIRLTDGIQNHATKLVLTFNLHIRFIGRITTNDHRTNSKVTAFLDVAR